MLNLPTLQEIKLLHKKYAPSKASYQSVFNHCQIVWKITEQLINAKDLNLDKNLVQAGCWLHDIGVYKLAAKNEPLEQVPEKEYVRHGVLGAEILRAEGLDEALARMAERHTGVGITKEDIEKQGLPLRHKDYIAETQEERLVMYADKFHSKSKGGHFNSFEEYKSYCSKFGAENPAKFEVLALEFGKPDLELIDLPH